MQSSNRSRITLTTCLVAISAVATSCALVVQIRQCYAAVPPFALPICAESIATPVVLLWVFLGSTATFALRRCSATRFAGQVAITSLLLTSRLWKPPFHGYEVTWPVLCFGIFCVTPLLLCRFSRIGDSLLILADSSLLAIMINVLVINDNIPKL
jgi:uncharacterized membrane protein